MLSSQNKTNFYDACADGAHWALGISPTAGSASLPFRRPRPLPPHQARKRVVHTTRVEPAWACLVNGNTVCACVCWVVGNMIKSEDPLSVTCYFLCNRIAPRVLNGQRSSIPVKALKSGRPNIRYRSYLLVDLRQDVLPAVLAVLAWQRAHELQDVWCLPYFVGFVHDLMRLEELQPSLLFPGTFLSCA